MKNLYPKGKGRIHPSPSSSSSSSSVGAAADAMAVLRLLPAAIVALTAALGDDDKEVLAYLISWSMNAAAPPPPPSAAAVDRRRFRTPAAAAAAAAQQQLQHPALFSCRCFDCYRSFWSRWDCSPDRELIHQAIEAYDSHVAAAQSDLHGGGGGGGSRATRRRERRSSEKREKAKAKAKAKSAIMSGETGSACDDGEAVIKEAEGGEEAVAVAVEEGEKLLEAGEEKLLEEAGRESEDAREGANEAVAEAEAVAVAVAVEVEERRRGWTDVTGLFNPRSWGLWRPGV